MDSKGSQPSWLDDPLPLPDEPASAADAEATGLDDGFLFAAPADRHAPAEPWEDLPPADAAPAAPKDRGLATGVTSREELAARITSRLNPEQARAVTTTDGPLLILAGAGSGKTRVVAHRVAYLVGVTGIAPWRILAVTFTNKAAGEMRERITALVGPDDGKKVEMGTFHAICARILRRDGAALGLDPHFVIYDTDDQLTLMKAIFREHDMPVQGGPIKPRSVLEALSKAKNDLAGTGALAEDARTYYQEQVATLAAAYQRRLRGAGALDFDDLLGETVRLFDEHPEVLARYQAKWKYLHVDEYQDTNRAQYRIVRALASAHHNLCVVGDDDQSIYAWRGADLRNILDFERDEPGATVVKLERNYRSTQLILDAAHSVVSNNEDRKEKQLWTEQAGGRRIQRFEAYDEEEEAEWIARQAEALMGGRGKSLARRADEETVRPKEIAVLYRTNAQSRAIEEAFLRWGIRYQLIGGTRFYQRREVKDALAYLRILRNDRDRVSFERVINVPPRGLGEKSLDILRIAGDDEGATYWFALERAALDGLGALTPRARTAIAQFVDVIRRLRGKVGLLPLPELLDEVMEASGYRAMLADNTEENEERWRNILELRSVSTRYDDLAPDDALDRLLEETALVADQDSYEGEADAVTLITLHAAKGLEFGAVFIAGMEEGIFPHKRAIDAERDEGDTKQLEEERRLAYVGITRAKERLYISHASRRATWGQGGGPSAPSRFLYEIPAELMEGPRLLPGGDGFDAGDLDLAFGARGASRLGFRAGGVRAGGGAYRSGSGRPGAPAPGEVFRPTRDLAAKRDAYDAGAASGSLEVPGRRRRWGDAVEIDPADHADARWFGEDLPSRQIDEDVRRPVVSDFRRRVEEAARVRAVPPGPSVSGSSVPGAAAGAAAGVPGATPRPGSAVTRLSALPPAGSVPRVRVPGERLFRDGDRVGHAKFGEGVVVTSKLTRDDEEVTVAFKGGGLKTLLASIANLEPLG